MAYTNYSNLSTLGDVLGAANTNTGGSFWTLMLYVFVIVMFTAMLMYGWEIALMVSLFAGIMIGTFLVYMGLVGLGWLGTLVAIEIFLIIYLMYSSMKQQ